MGSKFYNRYNSFCKSLKNLEKSRCANPEQDFVLAGTVQNYNLTFDLSWKVMKDIIVKHFGIINFAIGSPREVLQVAFQNGLIDNDVWIKMLKARNNLMHDYDGALAEELFEEIITCFYAEFEKLKDKINIFYDEEGNMIDRSDSFTGE